MVEVVLTGAIVAGGIAVLSRRGAAMPARLGAIRRASITVADGGPDLPCPWCRAATTEADTHCPNCHQPFG